MIAPRLRLALPLCALIALVVSACGSIATPEWAAEAQGTRVAQVSTDTYLTSIAPTPTATATMTPTLTPSPIPPTATLAPPTATFTPLPPTEPPPPTATLDAAEVASVAINQALEAGNPENGLAVFNSQRNMPDGSVWMCAQCHSITPDEARLIGPGQWNIAYRAGSRIPGVDAVTYVNRSIVAPLEYIVPGEPPYPPLMPAGYDVVLTEQELNDVIAYLFTLHE